MNMSELKELEKVVNSGKSEMCWIAPNRKQIKELIKIAIKEKEEEIERIEAEAGAEL